MKSGRGIRGWGHVNRNEGSVRPEKPLVGQTRNSSQKVPALRKKRWTVNLAAGLPSGYVDQ